MAFFAVEEDRLIGANEADPKKTYWCLECFGPVKCRKGRQYWAHFYHIREAPGCKLYSKSEDHWVAQLELQRLFPQGALHLEKPFLAIDRVADLCWEREKIIFEIQCSQIAEKEVEARVRDYKTAGYDVVWLLDDRRFNRKQLRPAESFLRTLSTYFLSVRSMEVYDQFEVFFEGRRVRKGARLPVQLTRVFRAPQQPLSFDQYPKQIVQLNLCRHFYGDRLSRALRFPEAMLREKALEEQWKPRRKPNWLMIWLKKYVAEPYIRWLERKTRY
ncbi:MAG: hypothetical protein KGQ49_00680 [Verrucomicrobia bacterium]|nr:hypothetical protein [Verrucomicrobiota bacterium]MDE3046731.1 hypothetical protein [Verrucomicrobiota bacterium]